VKVLLFIHSLSCGGAERVTANVANHWAGTGWEVALVTLASRELDFYQLHPRVRRIDLGLAGESGSAGMAVWNNLRRVLALRVVLRRERPEVAVAMMTTANVLLAAARAGMREPLCIGSEHTHPPKRRLGAPWEALREYLYGRLDAVVALTGESARWLRDNTNARRVAIIPNAVPWLIPSERPYLAVDGHVAGGRRLALAVGRLVPEKGLDLLLDAFAAIAPRHPLWDLAILGEGPVRGALEEQVRRLGLGGRVLLPGVAGNVEDWYGRADLFVLSSRFEGFGNVLVEALVSGLPAVSFDCDTGPRDIIRHGVDGLLVPPGDVRGLASALDTLMGDDDLRARLAARAVEARERFSMGRIAGMWEQLFAELRDPRVAATGV
jgi:glycosyltransferase involved in cell wall biosynthesis